jgi:hypothetical protein
MYSSWDELEQKIEVKSELTSDNAGKHNIQFCPCCGKKHRISKTLDGIFPYANCEPCHRSFFVRSDFKVRKLTEEEKAEIPNVWIQIVKDLAKKKVVILLG